MGVTDDDDNDEDNDKDTSPSAVTSLLTMCPDTWDSSNWVCLSFFWKFRLISISGYIQLCVPETISFF